MHYLTRLRTRTFTHTYYLYRLIPSQHRMFYVDLRWYPAQRECELARPADLGIFCYCIPNGYHGCVTRFLPYLGDA
jgi:hypothetical protein